jgi:malonate transporter
MSTLLAITGPIYLIVAIGYLCVRAGWFAKADLKVLGQFVLRVALPALIFNAVSSKSLADIVQPQYLLVFAGASLVTLGLGLIWARWVMGYSPAQAGILGMGMVCPNSGYVGFPIVLLTLPAVAGMGLALNMLVENLLLIPLTLMLAARGHSPAPWHRLIRQSLRDLIKTPFILALVLGLLMSLLGLHLPEVMQRMVHLLANASAGVSLFIIGGSLAGLSLRGLWGYISPILVGKLLIQPGLVALGLWLWNQSGLPVMSHDLQTAVLLFSAMPIMGIYPLMAMRHGLQDESAAAQLASTVLSFVTVSALLALIR